MRMDMDKARLILEYLQVLLSWPVITAVLAFYFLKSFKISIAGFLERVVRGQAYGFAFEAQGSPKQQEVGSSPLPEPEDAQKLVRDNPSGAVDLIKRLAQPYLFERAMNHIYGTQIDLLEHLAQKGDKGDTYVNLFTFYQTHTARWKSLGAVALPASFEHYLLFLISGGLIEKEPTDDEIIVRITPTGVDFLAYLKVHYPSARYMKPF